MPLRRGGIGVACGYRLWLSRRPYTSQPKFEWGHAIPYTKATKLVSDFDQLRDTTKSTSLRTGMPSSVMYRLKMKFHADIRRKRQAQGLRMHVLAILSNLRHLIQSYDGHDSRVVDNRLYYYLERLNLAYLELLRAQPQQIQYRHYNLNSMIHSTYQQPSDIQSQTLAMARHTIVPNNNQDGDRSPHFDREMYPMRRAERNRQQRMQSHLNSTVDIEGEQRRKRRVADSIDPRLPSWVDCFLNDITPQHAHRLFALVACSKVLPRVDVLYRSAIEEALAFAFVRKGYLLDSLESMRICTYFLRQQNAESKDAAHIDGGLVRLWNQAGAWCTQELVNDNGGSYLAELRFKRWNNVASELLMSLANNSKHNIQSLEAAWKFLGRWHRIWTPIMRHMCPEWRRGFGTNQDPHTYPYWRPKRPYRIRLHELTLSSPCILQLLIQFSRNGSLDRALELLGFATSEIGVPIDIAMYNIAFKGLSQNSSGSYTLPSLTAVLTPVNQNSLPLYSNTGDIALIKKLFQGMTRWKLEPNSGTLDALGMWCYQQNDTSLLKTIIDTFDKRWGIAPSERLKQHVDDIENV